MKSILFIFFLFAYNNIFSQIDDKIIEIGKNTSELLIQRKSIENSKYALKLEKLYPEQDFAKFKDSPAEFILGMLRGAELQLPITWNEIKSQAENLKMGKNATYQTAYFNKGGVDNYVVTCIIKSESSYFIFSFNLLKWNQEIYISRFYKEIRKYNTIEEVESNLFSIVNDENNKDLQELEEQLKDDEIVIDP